MNIIMESFDWDDPFSADKTNSRGSGKSSHDREHLRAFFPEDLYPNPRIIKLYFGYEKIVNDISARILIANANQRNGLFA